MNPAPAMVNEVLPLPGEAAEWAGATNEERTRVMIARPVFLGLVTCLVLIGCATPAQRCQEAATRDLRTINQLIAETEGNLERGFAIETEIRASPASVSFCTGFYNNVGFRFCSDNRVVERQRPVAIDPAAEQRKLNELKARRTEIERTSRAALASCQGV